MSVPPIDLAAEFGTPLYVYDLDVVRAQAEALRAALPYRPLQLLYAIKANSCPPVAKVLIEAGFGIDAVSPGEVALALRLGCPPQRVLYTENNATDDDLQAAQTAQALLGPAKRMLWKQKDLIQGYVSASLPHLEHGLRAAYHCKNAAAEIRAGERAAQYRPYGNNHSVLPGRRIAALSDSRVTMAAAAAKLREALRGVDNRRVGTASVPERGQR